MYDDNKISSIIHKMQAGLLQWCKSYRPDLIRCGLQASDKNVESKDIKRAIANSLINELHLSRRVIAYFSNPYQKHLADRLTAEIEKVNDFGGFDARQKNITIYYLLPIGEISSALDDCLAAISGQQVKSLTNHSGEAGDTSSQTRIKAELKPLLENVGAQDGGGKAKDKDKESQPKNYVKKGAVWEICFEGDTVHIPDSMGLPLIAYLLQNPIEPISAFDLERAVAKPSANRQNIDDLHEDLKDDEDGAPGLTITTTGRTINSRELAKANVDDLKDAIGNLEKQRDKTENEGIKKPLEDQIETLEKEIKRRTSKAGEIRPTEGDPYENARVRVIQNVKKIRDILKSDHKKLYNHFKKHLKTATECYYNPDPPIKWEIF